VKECVFCEIGSGHTETSLVYQDNLVFAIMTLEQPTPYKVIVIPYAHVETVYDLTDAQAAAIFQATVKLARVIRDVSGCEGVNDHPLKAGGLRQVGVAYNCALPQFGE
jgi:histidine triad (HIT) family protein